ncbi:MAG: dephospho-CoA kinase [Chloroflexota bacterium]
MTRSTAGRRALRIGLVGPIGCGKSTVAAWLADAGAAVIDADSHARAVLDIGEPALDEVVVAFGDDLLLADGSLDRAALATRVFDDPDALARLEAIVHPAVRPRILAALTAAEADGCAIVVLEAIRLVDAGYRPLMDEVWLVTCKPETQLARLALRGLEGAGAERRVGAQRGLLDRAATVADRVVSTDGPRTDVRRTVLSALEAAQAEFRAHPS